MPKPKLIETPQKMWDLFLQYKETVKSKPILVNDFVGKDGIKVFREKERPLTLDGFECWCYDNDITSNIPNYFANSNNAYLEYSSVCSRIRKSIRIDQIEGGMAGIYNPSITQRLNGLTEKTETTVKQEQPLFPEI